MIGKDVLVIDKNGLRKIIINRPKQLNAINCEVYSDITKSLKDAAVNDDIKITVLTGTGRFYSSGNDLSYFKCLVTDEKDVINEKIKILSDLYEEFVNVLLGFPKLIIAVVNGPAMGIAVTTLPLFDIVYASDKATFSTKFISIGQTPEACSTYTFPKLFGHSLTGDFLYMDRTLSAEEALTHGLVARVSSDLDKEIWPLIEEKAAKSNYIAITATKQLIKSGELQYMKLRNKEERILIESRTKSDECTNIMKEFLIRKSKL